MNHSDSDELNRRTAHRGMRITIVILVCLVLGAIGLTLLLNQPTPPVTAAIAFIGYTNDAHGVRCARFAFTNQSHFAIKWIGAFNPELQKGPPLNQTYNLGDDAVLAPGQSEIILVPMQPAFINKGPWKPVFLCARNGWRTRLGEWADSSPLVPTMFAGVPVQQFSTPWISP